MNRSMEFADKKTNLNIDKIFIIFLLVHVFLWSSISLFREVLPIDASECIYWGSLLDFGTNKHPPLAGWLAYFVYNLFGRTDISIYLLGQITIVTGFVYLYKLGKLFIGKTASILAVMLLETCFVYTYMGIYDGFNPNFLLLALFPAITYYFYKSVHQESIANWVKLGIFTGLSFLAKYQSIMLFIPLFTYLIITPNGRKQFKNKGFYFASILAFFIVLPHIVWLYKNNFFSFNYFLLSEQRYATFYTGLVKYIYAPLIFIFNQFITIVSIIFIYFTSMLFSKENVLKEKNINSDDKAFLLCSGVVPLLLQSTFALNGNYMIPQWGYSLLFMTGILLFYFFPFKITERTIKYIISWVAVGIVISFIVLTAVFTTERNFANRFPVRQVTNTLNEIYKSETGQEMKYIGGFIELSIPLCIYNNWKYVPVLNTYKFSNKWIDEEDLKNSGAIIVGRDAGRLYFEYIDATMPKLVSKPKIKRFKFTVKSVTGHEREYEMFYAIVMPKPNNQD